MTLPTQLVLGVLLGEPEREVYGSEVAAVSGLASGTVHPLLARLERFGWLISRWEDIDPHERGRPRRRYYRLTPSGVRDASAATASARLPGLVRDAAMFHRSSSSSRVAR